MRINFFGGPCLGKSTVASLVFARLKAEGYNVELITEYIKFWTYLGRHPESFDQVFTFSQQLHQEDVILRSGVDHVVSDSPLFLSCFYGYHQQVPCWTALYDIAIEFEKRHPSINVFLERGDKEYTRIGRYHDEKQAREIDKKLINIIQGRVKNIFFLPYDAHDQILEKVKSLL